MTLEQILEIIERYKLRIPPPVYYELLADVRNEQESQTFKWCTDCKEYDQEKHCCHRWSKVIRDTVEEMKQEQKIGHWIEVTNGRGGHECDVCHDYAPSFQNGNEYLSAFCPNCGAKMAETEEV